MRDTTKALLDKIDAQHDWQDGQMYSGGGTKFTQTDVCLVCSLKRHYLSDKQNGIPPTYSFTDGETGQEMSLRQALTRGCMGEAE